MEEMRPWRRSSWTRPRSTSSTLSRDTAPWVVAEPRYTTGCLWRGWQSWQISWSHSWMRTGSEVGCDPWGLMWLQKWAHSSEWSHRNFGCQLVVPSLCFWFRLGSCRILKGSTSNCWDLEGSLIGWLFIQESDSTLGFGGCSQLWKSKQMTRSDPLRCQKKNSTNQGCFTFFDKLFLKQIFRSCFFTDAFFFGTPWQEDVEVWMAWLVAYNPYNH